MPCNPYANDFLACLNAEALASIKKKIVEGIVAGALTTTQARNLPTSQNIDLSQYPKLQTAYNELESEGVFDMTQQELEEWLENN